MKKKIKNRVLYIVQQYKNTKQNYLLKLFLFSLPFSLFVFLPKSKKTSKSTPFYILSNIKGGKRRLKKLSVLLFRLTLIIFFSKVFKIGILKSKTLELLKRKMLAPTLLFKEDGKGCLHAFSAFSPIPF